MFQDTFLYLFQPIMIFVQGLFRIDDTQIIHGINTPWQRQHGLQIGQLYTIVRCLRIDSFQFGHFLLKSRSHFLRPVHMTTFHTKFIDFTILSVTQFVLDILDLLMQEILTLLTVNILTCTNLNGLLDISQTYLTVQDLNQLVHPVSQVVKSQQLHLLFRTEREIRTNKVDQNDWVIQILNGKSRVRRQTVRFLDKLIGQILTALHQSLEFIRLFIQFHLFQWCNLTFHVWQCTYDAVQMHSRTAGLHDGCSVTTRHFKNTKYPSYNTYMV